MKKSMPLPRLLLFPTLLLGLGGVCPAAVTYVDPPDITIPFSFQGVYLDLETEATNTPGAPGGSSGTGDYTVSFSEPASGDWDVNFFFGGAIIAHNTTFQPYRTDGGTDAGDNLSAIHKMTSGTTIDGSTVGVSQVNSTGPTYSTGGSGTTTGGDINGNQSPTHISPTPSATQFTSGSGDTGYIAFVLNPQTTPLYGWIQVTLADDGSTGSILDWAYSDQPLDVGTIPEPSSTLLLLLGSLALLRRKRS